MSDHAELENSVAAYVLGASEPDEQEEIVSHLDSCAGCREMAGRLQRAADVLPMAAEMVMPPPRLKAKILAAAASSPRNAVQPPTRARILRLPGSRRPAFAAFPALFESLRLSPQAAVAVLAVAVLGLGAWNMSLSNQLSDAQRHPRVVSAVMTGHDQLAGSQARVIDLRDQGVVLVSFSHLPKPSADMVYELWLITPAGNPEKAAVFQPEADGSKTLVMTTNLRGYKTMAVTIEAGPEGTLAPTQLPSMQLAMA